MGFIINPYQVQPSNAYGTLTTAWITATGETDTTILSALNTLESDLSTYGLTSKMKALYPFVGGTSTKHSYNFINTGLYQITWYGGITHNSNGITGNGSNAYGDTAFNLTTNFNSTSDASIGCYIRTDTSGLGVDIGSGFQNASNKGMLIYSSFSGTTYYGCAMGDSVINAGESNSDSRGFYSVVRNSGVQSQHKRGNVTINSSETEAVSTNLSSYNIWVAGGSGTGDQYQYSDRNLAFAFIGDALSQSNLDDFYTAVQAFQTTLSRNV
jgi:hypothetical protein